MGLDMILVLEDENKEMIEFSYYRKFNALHGYFINKYDIPNPCKLELTREMVVEISNLLNEVKFSPEKSRELLPTYEGFFFGSYEYDRLYHSYVNQASTDFYHAQFIDRNKYKLYYVADF